MADEIVPAAGAAPASQDAGAETPAVAAIAPESAPPAAEAAAPSVVEVAPDAAPEAIAEPVAEPPATEAAPEPAAEAAPAETPEPEAPPAPVYTDFKLPEGVQAAPEQVEAFTSVLAKHNLTQEAGQELMDLYGSEAKRYAEQLQQQQLDAFADTRASWRKEVDKRFGNRRDTAINDAKWAIEQLTPNEAARKSLWTTLAITGAGDHPDLIGLLSAAAKKMRERPAPAAGLPAPNRPSNPADRRYGASGA